MTVFTRLLLITSLLFGAHTLLPSVQGTAHAQQDYEIFVDERGRRFLVDPYTGEIVGRADRRRETARDRRQRRRQARRERRRNRLNNELGRLFGLPPIPRGLPLPPSPDELFGERRPRQGRGRYLDEPAIDDRERDIIEEDSDVVRPRTPRNRQQNGGDLARLPEPEQPVVKRRTTFNVAKPRYDREMMTALQVALDREGFSPGVIDGKWGSNVAKAMVAYREAKGDSVDLGRADVLRKRLDATGGAAIYNYTLTTTDVAGPFVARIPVDYAEKARLERMAYTSAAEKIAEKFHMSEAYLRELNPGKDFSRSGTRIRVVATGNPVRRKVHYLIADKSMEQVRALDRNGNLVVAYPATIGSASTPSPSGKHTVERIALNPEYTYNPKLNFQQGANDKILRIPPGPNGPVGSVWIALSKPTYGIHGTPNPDTIGKTNSHGCIRLTNWDAQELAKLVTKGVTVEFR